jgi:apolipoprotein D and lipocalin family protein
MKLSQLFLAGGLFIQGFVATATAQASIFPKTVPALDLESYMGLWYEIQSTRPFFQANCVCNTAEYTLRDDNVVNVVNSCRENSPDGPSKVVEGTATGSRDPGKFYVKFGGFSSPITNYWVVDLAPDYSFAVVSSFLRSPIWILSRTPSLPQETLEGIYERLTQNGFDTSALQTTQVEGCVR